MKSTINKRRSEFGQRLYEAREATLRCEHPARTKITQAQAAAAIGVSQGTWSQYETDPLSGGSSLVVHIARLFKVDPWWLASGEGQPYPPAQQFSQAASDVAAAFERMPERTPFEVEMKQRLHRSWLALVDRDAAMPLVIHVPAEARPVRGQRIVQMLERFKDPAVALAAEQAAMQAVSKLRPSAETPALPASEPAAAPAPARRPKRRTTRKPAPTRTR